MQDSVRRLTTGCRPFSENKQEELATNTLMIIERNNNALYELLVTDFILTIAGLWGYRSLMLLSQRNLVRANNWQVMFSHAVLYWSLASLYWLSLQ